ncbi:xanthine dehydrogenase family protein molybdopterin-binding subunit [Roseomonas nepalensis]|uniref:Xanthine dehydrogenase family protein molybdopterin-binding subunit n=1 Tax=Muricoccus nepalensis TaxID=1854500 RepID=A0A502G9F7_9PROT|nr:molybdopterin cofactor-binding domain-containing protein [Roseomonas nepalensis]TPG58579.1 xanthine dehydrogenase family protein molybdopterin-binding subunit [Roseomonas nepalensis]
MTLRLSRRAALRATGALVVTVAAAPGEAPAQPAGAGAPLSPLPPPGRLASYVAVHADGTATAFFGKIDGGQGLDVAIAQIVAEELDLPPARVRVVMGDTARTVNQGGASNASGVSQGAVPLRNAAAEARLMLVEMAAARLGVPPGALRVEDGTVSVAADPARRVTYEELIGDRRLDAELRWNGRYGNDLNVEGRARPKPIADYKVVGTAVPRRDIAEKVFARHAYVTDIRLPGMLHARMLRPPVAGARPVAVDEAPLRAIPGARAVWKEGFLAVAAPREWDAIRAAAALKVTWSEAAPPFPEQAALYDHIRNAPATKRGVPLQEGDAPAAIAGAARVVAAEYEWPFHSHSSMGPGCAVADVRPEGVRIWTGSQKPHAVRDGVAKFLGVPPETVHAVWVTGPGSYGRNDAGDTPFDAAFLSRELGAPVRVQYTRHEGHGWDTKSPASVQRVRAGLDAEGRVVGITFESKAFSRTNIATSEADPRDSLASQVLGGGLNPQDTYLFPGDFVPTEPYAFPARLMAWETIPPLLDRASPLRTSHLRDPLGPELIFAAESFVDELAAATGADPVEFRLRHLREERDIAVLRAITERAGWEPRPAGPRGAPGDRARGRGVSLARRDGTVVGLVAEVEVDRGSGAIRVRRMVVGQDCGLIINPDGLRRCVENALIYGTSRALREEVTFDRNNVTSVDWATYPILDVAEAPEAVEVVLINRPDIRPTGAGEPAVRTAGAAIANAVFDATGVRLRRGPFTPERVRAALAGA